jgi:F-type H+-transporting ATPase subunit c|tara:strand:- start:479 stop:712 length:234 start_codon:yes stop_codon:yes gene_type:complete
MMDLTIGLKAIGAGIAVIGMLGSGIGVGILAGKYFEAVARQPEVESKLKGNFMVALGFAEAIALFAFAIAALIIFVL